MSSPKLIMFLAFMFVVGLVLSFAMSGTWFGSDEADVMNKLTVFKVYDVGGLFSVPWINADFFTDGVPRLLNWDTAFFGGEARIIQYFLYVVTIGFIFGILPTVIAVLQIIRG